MYNNIEKRDSHITMWLIELGFKNLSYSKLLWLHWFQLSYFCAK